MQLVGRTLDIYQVGEELGRGGMGSVYRAQSTADGVAGPAGAVVAIKVFHAQLALEERVFERFRREAEIGQDLNHPNVVRTFGAGRCDVDGEECNYMVMEYVEGQTLDGLREELGTVPDHLLFLIADQTLAGLQAIHEHGVIHRDIKPENIVITNTHRVLIMDLGVARLQAHGYTLTEQGEFVGSLHYAAPEQLDSEAEIRPPCDLYSFGTVLYELATGRRAFDATDLAALLHQKMMGQISRPQEIQSEVDPFWDEVITTCLEREPARRFGTADELRGILQDGTQSAWWRDRTAGREPSGAERALKRLRLARETPFLGREAEMEQLRRVYGKAQGGEGQVLLVGGPSGSGKSRLIYEFVEALSSATGPRVAAGRAVGQGGRAYQPFVEVAHDLLAIDDLETGKRREGLESRLTELLPDRPGVVTPLADFLLADIAADEGTGLEKNALLASFDGLLRQVAGDRPTVLVIEDAHMAGDDTLDLFGYVARNLADRPVLLIGIYDDEMVEDGSELHRLLTEASSRENASTLRLGALSRAACDDLVRAVVLHERTVHSLSSLLFRRSDGNPLIILEVMAQLRSTDVLAPEGEGLVLTRQIGLFELPSKVADLIHFKLTSLDEELRETLDTAAVLGHEFQASVLAAMLGERRIKLLKRLALLERRHRLIQSSGKDAFRFAKRQIGEVLYQGIPPDLRTEYHSLAADTLIEKHEEEGALPGSVAFQVVRHLIQGDRSDEVEPHAVAASRHAIANYHATYVSPFLERVAAAIADAAPEIRFEICRQKWECYGSLGRRKDQAEILDQAHELAREAGDSSRLAQVVCLQGVTKWRTGEYESARALAEEALALAREAGNAEWEANALHALGAVIRHLGEFESCANCWREALEIRRQIGDRNGEARSLASLGVVMPRLGERRGALEAKENALTIFQELGDRQSEGTMLNNIGNTLLEEGRVEAATERFKQAIEIAREFGSLAHEGHPTVNLGKAYAMLGYPNRARETLRRALALFREAHIQIGVLDALRILADALISFGDYAGAQDALMEGRELAERSGSKVAACALETRLATARDHAGRRKEADAGFERALALADELHEPGLRHPVLLAMGEAALRAKDPDRAIPVLERSLDLAEEADLGALDRVLLRARLAWAIWLRGGAEDATSQARAAAELLGEDLDLPPETGSEICYVLGTLLDTEAERGRYFQRARELVTAKANAIRDPSFRDHYLRRTWPARVILAEEGKTVG